MGRLKASVKQVSIQLKFIVSAVVLSFCSLIVLSVEHVILAAGMIGVSLLCCIHSVRISNGKELIIPILGCVFVFGIAAYELTLAIFIRFSN